jgi:hypothetical protein
MQCPAAPTLRPTIRDAQDDNGDSFGLAARATASIVVAHRAAP